MTLKSRLAIIVYANLPNSTTPSNYLSQNITDLVEDLTFSTVAPGGFGTFSALLRTRAVKVALPQFSLFARVAVMAGPTCVWLGELTNPAYGLNQADGDYIRLSAIGIGNCLRDNPGNWSYSNTAQQIARDQLTHHTGGVDNSLTALISTDSSQLFPDNPTRTITQVYTGRNMEEILADAALLAGNYNYGTEADPVNKDSAGMPLGRVFARAKVLTSVDYQALLSARDIESAEFTPSADRAYNAIEVRYANGTSGAASAIATDSRLNGDLSQGSAPFRYRRYMRDLSGTSVVNSTIAGSLASTQLGLFQNVTYKGTAVLRGVKDGIGNPMPLWQAAAGANLYVPELAIQGQQLPTTPTQNVNLFWISQAVYREDASGNQALDLTLGYTPDDEGVQIARLQLAADALNRAHQVTTVVQSVGAPMYGQYAFEFSNAIGGAQEGAAVTFPARAYQAPTSLTLSSLAASNVGALSVTDFTAVGAFVYATVTAGGSGYARGTYQTVGNCLLDVNAEAQRFAHHCDVCDHAHQDLSLSGDAGHLIVNRIDADHTGLTVVCPHCAGRTQEGFNLALTEADEQGAWAHRATQARLIRQLMRAHGLALR